MTAPVLRSSSFAHYGSRASLTNVAKPAGVVDGDTLLATWFTGSGTNSFTGIAAPAGWTQVGGNTANDGGDFFGQLQVFWKRAASEPASYDFLHGGTLSTEIFIIAYSGCDPAPIDAFSVNSANTAPDRLATGLSVTTTVATDVLIYTGNNWEGSGNLTPPTGMTEQYEFVVYTADQALTATGATGDRIQNIINSTPWSALLVALKPAATAISLTAAALVAPPPVTASPALTQQHGLAAVVLAAPLPALGAPVVAQQQVLDAGGLLSSQPALGIPGFAQLQALAAGALVTPAAELTAPSLASSGLTGVPLLAPEPVLGVATTTQIHLLISGNLLPALPIFSFPEIISQAIATKVILTGQVGFAPVSATVSVHGQELRGQV